MNAKIIYLNEYLDSKNTNYYNGPKTLFKYRPFDKYSFDMIENKYIFLCPAENLDDETECITTLDLQNLYEINNNALKKYCVDLIIDMLRPYSTPQNFELVKNKIYRIIKNDYTIPPTFLLDVVHEIKELVPGIDISPFINYLVYIPEKIDEPGIKAQFLNLISITMDARKVIGVCSLSESCDVEDMWLNYADNHSGYCIEYDVSEYSYGQIFPVIYDDERETNIVTSLVSNFVAQMIEGISNRQINVDKSQYIRLFLSKYKKWEYQKEWRVLGGAGTKIDAPPIKTIYLGKNVTIENENKIRELAEKMSFVVIKRGE